MSEPLAIVAAASDLFEQQTLTGQHVVIMAGPTRERIDPVRYLSNFSTGKMGFALAEAAVEAGAKVTLIAGPVNLSTPDRVELNRCHFSGSNASGSSAMCCTSINFYCGAAVADFRPLRRPIKK